VSETLERLDLAVSPLTPAVAVEAALLPAGFHSDPADRLTVATARVEKAMLVTRDQAILAYAEAGHVAALRA